MQVSEQLPQASGDREEAACLSLLPHHIVMRILARTRGQELLAVNRAFRAMCHAHATAVTLTRGYGGAADNAHIAIMARCPRLKRVVATRVSPDEAPWPLAALTRVTSLSARPHWRAEHLPPSLRELTVPELTADPDSWELWKGPGQLSWDDGLDLLLELRDAPVTVHVRSAKPNKHRLRTLRPFHRTLRLSALQLSSEVQCLSSLPADFPHLTSVELYASLIVTTEPLAKLPLLQDLHLDCCFLLTSIDGALTALTALRITACEALTNLDKAMPRMPRLRRLAVIMSAPPLNTARAAALAPALDSLRLDCHTPEHLQSLHACTRLTSLDLFCIGCAPRTEDLQPLSALQGLALFDISVQVNAHSFGGAIAAHLTMLAVQRSRVPSLAGLSHLSALQRLELHDTATLTSFSGLRSSGLPHLTSVAVSNCSKLPSLAGLPGTPRLKQLNLTKCPSITSIQCRGLSSVTQLLLYRCCGLRGLGELAVARKLRHLELSGMTLTSLHGLLHASQLTELDISACKGLLDLRDLGAKPLLQQVTLGDVAGLTSLRGLDAPSLAELCVMDCAALSSLEGLTASTGLTLLKLSGCGVTSLGGLAPAARLEVLCLSQLTKPRSLHKLLCFNLSALQQLHIVDVTMRAPARLQSSNNTDLRALTGATKLACLHLDSLKELKSLKGLKGAVELQALTLRNIPQLRSLRGVAAAQLTSLDLQGVKVSCNDAQMNTARLKELRLVACERVRSLAALAAPGFASLARLTVKNLPLRDLLGLETTTRLREVALYHCAKLTTFEGLLHHDGRMRSPVANRSLELFVEDCGITLSEAREMMSSQEETGSEAAPGHLAPEGPSFCSDSGDPVD